MTAFLTDGSMFLHLVGLISAVVKGDRQHGWDMISSVLTLLVCLPASARFPQVLELPCLFYRRTSDMVKYILCTAKAKLPPVDWLLSFLRMWLIYGMLQLRLWARGGEDQKGLRLTPSLQSVLSPAWRISWSIWAVSILPSCVWFDITCFCLACIYYTWQKICSNADRGSAIYT